MYHKALEMKFKKNYIQNSSAIVYGVPFTPPFSKQAGIFRRLHAMQRRNNETPWKKGDGALNYVYLNVGSRGCANVHLSDGNHKRPTVENTWLRSSK